MNWGAIIYNVLHFLGIAGDGNSTDTTTLSTTGTFMTTTLTPIILDNKTFSSTYTPKILTTILDGKDITVTGETAESEIVVTGTGTTLPPITSVNTTTSGTTEISTSSSTEISTSSSTEISTSSSTEISTASSTEISTASSTESTITTSISSGTSEEPNVTTADQTPSTDSNHTTENVTVTTTDIPVTNSSDTTGTTSTGSETTTSGDITGTPSGTTDTPPTEKPKLTRGAVAGIVIGCLLLVAIITAAVVFFVKNRGTSPEAQRLRV